MAGRLRQLVKALQLRAILKPCGGCRIDKFIESGPPEDIANTLQERCADELAKKKVLCAKARADMGWPSRKGA